MARTMEGNPRDAKGTLPEVRKVFRENAELHGRCNSLERMNETLRRENERLNREVENLRGRLSANGTR